MRLYLHQFLNWGLILAVVCCANFAAASYPTVENNVVFSDSQLFAGWPANEGMWQWGDEMLVAFNVAKYQEQENTHNTAPGSYQWVNFARSLDGGQSWAIEHHPEVSTPGIFNGSGQYVKASGYPAIPAPQPSPGGFDFTSSGFALKARNDKFWVTDDRGQSWSQPYSLPSFGENFLRARTSYLTLDSQTMLLFYEGTDINPSVGEHARTMVVRTTDGGQTFEQLSWLTPDPADSAPPSTYPAYGLMPDVTQLEDGTILAAVRWRVQNNMETRIVSSSDNGLSWQQLSTPVTGNNNPASLVSLGGDRVAMVYGTRSPNYGIHAKVSEDGGLTWPSEFVLRNDGREWDLGYVQSALRSDGRITSAYYYTTDVMPANFIGSTIWQVPTATTGLDSLVAHYSFNESAGPTLHDSRGNPGAHGTTQNVSFTNSGAGKPGAEFGNAGVFNGTTSNVSFGEEAHPPSFDLGESDFTISGWFKAPTNTASGAGGNRPVFQNVDYSNGGWAFEIGRSDRTYAGKMFFSVGGGDSAEFSQTQAFSDARIDDNQWHWVAIVSEAGEISMFIDGKLQNDTGEMQSRSVATSPSDIEAQFGARGSSQIPYAGQLDDWRIYKSALTGDLNGSNTLIGGDLFTIWQTASDVLLAGDFNSDGRVDNADLVIWQEGYGQTSGANTSDGDADGDGDVDGRDFLTWQRNITFSASQTAIQSIPEPFTWNLLGSGIIFGLFIRRLS
jgi:hypothetical protein